MSLTLSGCGGSDGEDGAQGAPGFQGEQGETGDAGTPGADGEGLKVSTKDAHAVTSYRDAEITDVVINEGTFSLTFTVADSANVTSPDFTIAKWVADKGTWVSLLQRGRQRAATDTLVIRGNNFRVGMTTGTDNTYTYTFLTGGATGDPIDFRNGAYWTHAAPVGEGEYGDYVAGIVDTVIEDAAWDENAIYRVGVSGFVGDASYETQYYTDIAYIYGTGDAVADADIPVMPVNADSCYSCHGGNEVNGEKYLKFHAHGGFRATIDYCYTCHGDYAYDSKSSEAVVDGWAKIDLMTMVHKIHSGIDGYFIDTYEFGDVRFPDWLHGERGLGPKNCVACHKGEIPAGGTSWNKFDKETCQSCHIGDTGDSANGKINFANGDFLHNNLGSTFDNCSTCHSGSSAEGVHDVSAKLAELEDLNSYVMEVVSVENAVNGAVPIVTWRVSKDGVYQDLFAGADTYDDNVRIGIGWGYGDDFTNEGVGAPYNSAAGEKGRHFYSVVNTADADPLLVNTVAGTDNTYAVTTFQSVLPAKVADYEADGFGFVALERGPAIGMTPSTIKKFPLQVAEVTEFTDRRDVVDIDKCLGCHTTVTRHGTNADKGVETCIACHNAGSLSRDVLAGSMNNGVVQGSVDFMVLMHGIHGATERSDEFSFERRRAFDYVDDSNPYGDHDGYGKITYSKSIMDCSACHIDGTESFPVDNTKRLGVIGNDWKVEYDNGTGGVTSPNAAVCYSCHQLDDTLDDNTVKAHMTVEGGNMVYKTMTHLDYLDRSTESCMICHK
jgi:OmcA/MtrC family decaheme c-type cytochrome